VGQDRGYRALKLEGVVSYAGRSEARSNVLSVDPELTKTCELSG